MFMITNKIFNNSIIIIKLWVHESSRVFRDRLLTSDDMSWFDSITRKYVVENFNKNPEDIYCGERILFGD